ncbi:DUF1573 domain-containing protein [Reichenbachiella sp. MALMAid0571]|uniref:DUF1573 domain-containing protein n=1 Tax=Reichenbachiella sp. MALMAid0571 TaxID=3143939 RepID=UPI0032DE8098
MRIFNLLVLLLSGYIASAQEKGKLKFVEETFDFGEVREEADPIIHQFEFTNTGATPIIISNVKASCGCTTPGWSKEPVLPGKKGFVKAQYNPMNRPGAFKKSLTITSNGENPREILYIQGKVIPKVKTVEEELRAKSGALRMKNKTVNMGRVTTQKAVVRQIDVYNDSDSAFSFTGKVLAPEFINLSFEPTTLQPKTKGKININYDPNFQNNLGFQNHNVKFFTDESDEQEKELNVMATITEYFAPLSQEEKQQAPQLNIPNRISDIGKISKNTVKETQFTLTNGGKNNLNIRKVMSNCNCVIVQLQDYDVKPGESTTLTAEFDGQGRRGNQLKTITIYSNDPVAPTQTVSIKAVVEN